MQYLASVLSSFATPVPAGICSGLTFDGTNLISCDINTKLIYVHNGISATVLSSFVSPSSAPSGLAFDGTNLISCDRNTDLIYVHNGISATVLSSFSSPSAYTWGLAFDGANLLSIDWSSDIIYVHNGVSAAVANSFTGPDTHMSGIAFDGTNLITCDQWTDIIYVHDGISANILYSFLAPSTTTRNLLFNGTNLMSASTFAYRIYTHGNGTDNFSTYANKAVSSFRVLIDINSKDGLYKGRFSFNAFTPNSGLITYEGRLFQAPSISISRDSSFFGILVFSSSGITLNNSDGTFDALVDNYNIIGATVQIKIGYEEVHIANYKTIYTGYVESVSVDEEKVSINIGDLRKRLLGSNTTDIDMYTDAVTAVENILKGNYTSAYFDVSAMAIAKVSAPFIYRPAPENDTIQEAIEACVKSTMGFFFITGDGKYSYKMIDTDATSVTTISHYDIINEHSIEYNTDEIIAKLTLDSFEWTDFVSGPWLTAKASYVNNNNTMTPKDSVIYAAGYYGATAVTSYILRSNNLFVDYDQILISSTAASYRSELVGIIGSAESLYIMANTMASNGTHKLFISNDGGGTWTYKMAFGASSNCESAVTITEQIVVALNVYATSCTVYRYDPAGAATAPTVISPAGGKEEIILGVSTMHKGQGGVLIATAASTMLMYGYRDVFDGFFDFDNYAFMYKTTDYGSSWSSIMPIATTWSSYTRKAAVVSSSIYIAVIHEPLITTYSGSVLVPHTHIYITFDSGATWELLYQYSNIWEYAYPSNFVITTQGIFFALYFNISKTCKIYKILLDFSTGLPINQLEQVGEGIANFNYSYAMSLIHEPNNNTLTLQSGSYIYHLSLGTAYTLNTSASTLSTLYTVDTFKEKETLIWDISDTTILANKQYDYFNSLHGKLDITVHIKYYYLNIGDNVDVEIWRESTAFLGTKKCEILSKSYDLDNALITFGLRII